MSDLFHLRLLKTMEVHEKFFSNGVRSVDNEIVSKGLFTHSNTIPVIVIVSVKAYYCANGGWCDIYISNTLPRHLA